MYRNPKAAGDSDDSGDERKLPVFDDDDNDNDSYEPKKKRENIWKDVAVDQSLNQHMSSRITIEKGSKTQRVNRGAESYDAPVDQGMDKADSMTKDVPVVTITPASDDPFGDNADLSAVEGFGVAYNLPKKKFERGGIAPFRGHRKRDSSNPGSSVREDIPTADGEKKEEKRDGGGWMRGRGRGQYWQNRGRGGFGMKRNFTGGWANDPKKIIAPEYSLEALMAVEFTEGLPLPQLGQEIATALGEKDPATVLRIVELVGEQKSLQLFEETRQIETNGGMKVMDGSRRRTPGGVFISLLKTDVDVSPEVKDKIFEAGKADQKRQYKQAKRRNFEGKMQEVAELIKKEKEKEAESKELPDVTEAVAADVSSPVPDAMES